MPGLAGERSARTRSGPSLQLHDAPLVERGAQRDADARGLGRVVQRQRRRAVVAHAVGEVRELAQERVGEALVERRRGLGADAVRVGDLDLR